MTGARRAKPVAGRKAALAHFATLVRRRREEMGHATARAFFRAQGGPAFFGCAYRAYLNFERGVSAPQPLLVERLAATLRVAFDEAAAREFALAYLRVVLGFDDFLEFAVEILADRAAPGPGGARLERDRFDAGAAPLSPEQARTLCGGFADFWCFAVLAGDGVRRACAELARLLEIPEARALGALRRLGRAGLVARAKDGRWRALRGGAISPVERPGGETAGPGALRPHWDAMAERVGEEVLLDHPLLLRASESELRNYLPYLSQSVLAAGLYSTRRGEPDAAFFLIEAAARRLLPF